VLVCPNVGLDMAILGMDLLVDMIRILQRHFDLPLIIDATFG